MGTDRDISVFRALWRMVGFRSWNLNFRSIRRICADLCTISMRIFAPALSSVKMRPAADGLFCPRFGFCVRRAVPDFPFQSLARNPVGDRRIFFVSPERPSVESRFRLHTERRFFVSAEYRPGDRRRYSQPCPLPFIRGIIRLSRLKRRAGFVYRSRKSEKRCLYTP